MTSPFPFPAYRVSLPDAFHEFLNSEAYLTFLEDACTQAAVTYVTLTFPVEAVDPLVCLQVLSKQSEFRYFWEMPQQELSIAAGKQLITIRAAGPSRFEQVNDRIDAIKSQTAEFSTIPHDCSGLNFLGGFSFYEENKDPDWKSFGAASFSVPEWLVVRDGKLSLLTITLDVSEMVSADQLNREVQTKLQSISKVFTQDTQPVIENYTGQSAGVSMSLHQPESAYQQWVESVKKAKEHIHNKLFDKIVLAREFLVETEKKLAPVHIVNSLRQQYPNCYSFLIGNRGEKTFIGCSPELLVAFKKNFLFTEALAGSIRRGTTVAQDLFFEERLLASEKNYNEHYFVIKAIEQKLRSFVHMVDRNADPGIKKFANVQHLFTPVAARMKENVDRFTILKELHPTPAVGGYPWEKAAEYIRELEYFNRGWYAGPVGWLNSKGDGEFAVAIRSGLIYDTAARFYAGCGIVASSSPDAEWQETNLKLTPMLTALRYD